MQTLLVHVAILAAYYIIGAYATTDILRLLRGCEIPVMAAKCYCPVCKKELEWKDQIPIFSYLFQKGKCRNCKYAIPKADFFFEIFLFLSLTLITALLGYRKSAFFLCVVFYEGTKFFSLLRKGRRRRDFGKNLFCSLCSNILIFALLFLMFVAEEVSR